MSRATPPDRAEQHAAPDRWGVRREMRDLLVAVTGGAIVGSYRVD